MCQACHELLDALDNLCSAQPSESPIWDSHRWQNAFDDASSLVSKHRSNPSLLPPIPPGTIKMTADGRVVRGKQESQFLLWLKSLFSWNEIGVKGAWAYHENVLTGKRKISKRYLGHSPIDNHWLAGGEWERDMSKIQPPNQGSGGRFYNIHGCSGACCRGPG